MKASERRYNQTSSNLKRLAVGTSVKYQYAGFNQTGRILSIELDSFKIDCQTTKEVHTVPLYSVFIEPIEETSNEF